MRDDLVRTPNRAMNRRQFLRAAGATGAGLVLAAASQPASGGPGDALMTRVLGRTKEKVSILGLGTAPAGEGPVGLQEGIRIFSEAIEQSIQNVQIARKYKPLSAEKRNALLEYGRKLALTLGPRYGAVT